MVSLRDLHVQMHALLTQEEPWAASHTGPMLSDPALLWLSQLGYGSPFWNPAPSPLCAFFILLTINPYKPHCSLPGGQGFLCTHVIRLCFHLILTECWRERGVVCSLDGEKSSP